ncbi:hypothetical protein ACOSQ4_004150 [Xanthoceras sorbifolium]
MNRAGLSTSFGSLFLLIGAWLLYTIMKRRKKIKLKEKFFKQNVLIEASCLTQRSYITPQTILIKKNEELPFTWDMRLRIASEVAGLFLICISQLLNPFIIETSIKVADFRTSRSITIDHTHVTTRVQRTFGYFFPEYFRSSQFTDKSDLLNGQKPIFSTVTEEGRSLTSYFIKAMEENNLYDILDAQVKMGKEEEITAVADLAIRCVNLHGKQRPTMKEVAMDLDGIPAPEKVNNVQLNVENFKYESFEATESCDSSTSKSSTYQ